MIRPPRVTSLAINLAPMVDVMMCTLIFFMLATKMVERENSTIDLPLALAAKEVNKKDLGNRFVVNIRKAAAGAEYVVGEEVMPLDAVLQRLDAVRRSAGSADEINCIIRAERSVAYRHVDELLRGCSKAEVRNVTFAALQGEGGG